MKKCLLLLAACYLVSTASAQQVMTQGWYWDDPETARGKSWADTLLLKAASLKQAGITHLWMPLHLPASSYAAGNGYESPVVDHLNRFSTPYSSNFRQGAQDSVLIYQLHGSAANGNRDVIVAINFGSSTLKVDHQINNNGGAILPNTQFTDVLGRSAFPYAVMNNSNEVYIELLPNSYSVWVQGTATVLPLQLLNFNVQVLSNVVQLQWAIAENDEVKSFDIERADDGVKFVKVGSRLGINRSGMAAYDFVDATPKKNAGMLYRLKIIGKDGTEIFSDLKLARVDEGEMAVKLKQNPVRSNLELEINATEAGKAVVSVISAAGQQVLKQSVKISAGVNPVTLPVQSMAQGIYQLVVEAGSKSKIISFVKE